MRWIVLCLMAGCSEDSARTDERASDPADDPTADTADPSDTSASVPSGWLVISSGDEPFDCLWDESTCPTDCAANTPPSLAAPEVWVNGMPGAQPMLGDTVTLTFPYGDAEDNLRCGGFGESAVTPLLQQDNAGSLCSNFPASSASSGVILTAEFVLDAPGSYSRTLTLYDACGASSDRVEWSLELP